MHVADAIARDALIDRVRCLPVDHDREHLSARSRSTSVLIDQKYAPTPHSSVVSFLQYVIVTTIASSI
jgi:hypothetical protein